MTRKKLSHNERRRQAAAKDKRNRTQMVRSRILSVLHAHGEDVVVTPTTIAKDIDEIRWREYLKEIRAQAIQLAREDRIEVLRKGKWISPDKVRGIVKFRLVPADLLAELEEE